MDLHNVLLADFESLVIKVKQVPSGGSGLGLEPLAIIIAAFIAVK